LQAAAQFVHWRDISRNISHVRCMYIPPFSLVSVWPLGSPGLELAGFADTKGRLDRKMNVVKFTKD